MIKATLYIVATPIGNLSDITYRAVNILRQVPYILAEDTRHAKKLLTHINAYPALTTHSDAHNTTDNTMQNMRRSSKILSYHRHNEKSMQEKVATILDNGDDIALISDAGTPAISDPGALLVAFLRQYNYNIVPIPGANAAIAALSAAGLVDDKFYFCGFLPAKRKARLDYVQQLAHSTVNMGVIIIYVAPHDVIEILGDIDTIYSNYTMILVRELTKIYEDFITGNADDIIHYLTTNQKCRGEMVLLLYPNQDDDSHAITKEDMQKCRQLLTLCHHHAMSQKDMVHFALQYLNLPKRVIYQEALNIAKKT